MKNKGVKLPFVTKNSKDLVGTGADDLLSLIEFTPLWKTKCQITLCNWKIKIARYICMQQQQNSRNLHLLL